MFSKAFFSFEIVYVSHFIAYKIGYVYLRCEDLNWLILIVILFILSPHNKKKFKSKFL